jgi:hypothetical protein
LSTTPIAARYISIEYTEHLAEAGIEPSGDAKARHFAMPYQPAMAA